MYFRISRSGLSILFFQRSLLTSSIFLFYDYSYCHELCEIESRASRLTERAMERAAQSPSSSEETTISLPVVQFRYYGHDLLASKKVPRGLVERTLRVRNKIDEIFTARVTWRGSRSHLQAVGLSHKVTRKFITIVIRPIHNTTAIYCRNIGSDIATVENCLYHMRVREHRELQQCRGISQISYKLLFTIWNTYVIYSALFLIDIILNRKEFLPLILR